MTLNFNEPYKRENWIEFLRQHFLPQDYSTASEKTETEFKPNCINEDVLYLGESQSLKLKIYEMHHDSENDPRIGLSRDAFKFIEHQKVKNALIFFVPQTKTSEVSKTSEVYSNYRFSLITRELKLEGKKVTKEFTNPKRYSYFMGPEVKKHTIEEFLVKKGRIKDEEDLKSLHLFMDKVEHKYAVRFYAGKFSKQAIRTNAGKEFILLNLPYFLVGRIFHYLEWFVEK